MIPENCLSNRFRYSSGGAEMNGFFMDGNLTDDERIICLTLVKAGLKGMSERSVRSNKISGPEFDGLLKEGIIKELTVNKKRRYQVTEILYEYMDLIYE